MNKKIGLVIVIVFLSLFLVQTVDARIFVNIPKDIYSLHEQLKFDIVVKNEDFSGFIKLSMFCNDNSEGQLIFYNSLIIKENQEKKFPIELILENPGNCFVRVDMIKNNEIVKSQDFPSFLISNELELVINDFELLNEQEFLPESTIKLSGTVSKIFGDKYDGTIILNVFDKDIEVSVSKGKFLYSFLIPRDISSGNKIINIKIDENGYFIENNINIIIQQVPTNLRISLNKPNFQPGEEVVIVPTLLDQSNETMPGNITIIVQKEKAPVLGIDNALSLQENLVKSGEETKFKLKYNSYSGEYSVLAKYGELSTKETFFIPVVEEISIQIKDNILSVTNIGNVPYQQPLEIFFESSGQTYSKVIDLDLYLGEQQEFTLEAPEGIYNLRLKSSEKIVSFDKIPLSGNAINTSIINESPTKKTLIYIAIILITIIFICVFFIVKKKKNGKVLIPQDKYIEVKKEQSIPDNEIQRILNEEKAGYLIQNKPNIKNREKQLTINQMKFSREKLREYPENDGFSDLSLVEHIFRENTKELEANKIELSATPGQEKNISISLIKINNLVELARLKKRDTALFNKLTSLFFKGLAMLLIRERVYASLQNDLLIMISGDEEGISRILKLCKDLINLSKTFNKEVVLEGETFNISFSCGIHKGKAIISDPANGVVYYNSLKNTTKIVKALSSKAKENQIIISSPAKESLNLDPYDIQKITPVQFDEYAIESFKILSSSEKLRESMTQKETPYWAKENN